MHLYVIARANKDRLERWINDVTAQYVPMEYEPGKTGNLQLAVRPVQLLEIVFPENQLHEVLKIVRPTTIHKSKIVYALRKLLGLEKLDTKIENRLFYRVGNDNVAITLIGTKKDVFIKGIEQI